MPWKNITERINIENVLGHWPGLFSPYTERPIFNERK